MKNDPYNHTRRKHKWSWHNCGCIWDKVAVEWAGDEDWTCRRERYQTIEDKKRFVNFALRSVKHLTIHRTKIGRKEENWRPHGPPTFPFTPAKKGRRCSCVETVMMLENGSTDIMLWNKSIEGRSAFFKRNCTHGEQEGSHIPSRSSTIT